MQNPGPVSNVQLVTSELVPSMTTTSPMPVVQPVTDIQSMFSGTGPSVLGMASTGLGSTVHPTSSNMDQLEPGAPAALSFWSLLKSTFSVFVALKEWVSLVAPQTSSTHTHPDELCHDNTLIMVITTIFKYFTFKEKGMTDMNARGTPPTA